MFTVNIDSSLGFYFSSCIEIFVCVSADGWITAECGTENVADGAVAEPPLDEQGRGFLAASLHAHNRCHLLTFSPIGDGNGGAQVTPARSPNALLSGLLPCHRCCLDCRTSRIPQALGFWRDMAAWYGRERRIIVGDGGKVIIG